MVWLKGGKRCVSLPFGATFSTAIRAIDLCQQGRCAHCGRGLVAACLVQSPFHMSWKKVETASFGSSRDPRVIRLRQQYRAEKPAAGRTALRERFASFPSTVDGPGNHYHCGSSRRARAIRQRTHREPLVTDQQFGNKYGAPVTLRCFSFLSQRHSSLDTGPCAQWCP